LVKHFAAALGERGIRVNAVAPGVVPTDMSSFAKTDAGREFTLGIQALKRMAQADDIGAAIVFLASDEARWITGDTLRVDGGSGSPLLAGSVSIGMILYISTNEPTAAIAFNTRPEDTADAAGRQLEAG
jgi:hypothetical protein